MARVRRRRAGSGRTVRRSSTSRCCRSSARCRRRTRRTRQMPVGRLPATANVERHVDRQGRCAARVPDPGRRRGADRTPPRPLRRAARRGPRGHGAGGPVDRPGDGRPRRARVRLRRLPRGQPRRARGPAREQPRGAGPAGPEPPRRRRLGHGPPRRHGRSVHPVRVRALPRGRRRHGAVRVADRDQAGTGLHDRHHRPRADRDHGRDRERDAVDRGDAARGRAVPRRRHRRGPARARHPRRGEPVGPDRRHGLLQLRERA